MTKFLLWQKAKVYKYLGVLNGVSTFLFRAFPTLYHQYRKQKECRRMELLPCFAPLGLVGFPYTEDTIYGEIGLGVYQGNLLVFGQSANHTGVPRRWVVDKLHAAYLCRIRRDIPCLLFQAATIILQSLQSSPVMQDSQKVDQIELLKHCPHSIEQNMMQFSPSNEGNIAECPDIEQLLRLLRQHNQGCQKEYPSTCPYSTANNSANQPNGDDTKQTRALHELTECSILKVVCPKPGPFRALLHLCSLRLSTYPGA